MCSLSQSWPWLLAFATAVLSLPNSFQRLTNSSSVRNHTEQVSSVLSTVTSISTNGSIAANASSCGAHGSIGFIECSCSAHALAFSSSHATTTWITSNCYSWNKDPDFCTTQSKTLLGTDYSPPDECCHNCEIYVEKLQIVYWPPNTMGLKMNITAAPPTPYTLVSDGYTFTSPSVYVVYEGMHAIRECFAQGVLGVGSTYNNITKAYDPNALSVAYQCYAPYSHFRPINYTELYYPPANSEVMTKSDCVIPDGLRRPPGADSGLAGHLQLSLPGDLSSIDSLWGSCRPGSWGGWDPPRALLKVSALGDSAQDPAGTPVATSNLDITSAQSPTSTAAATRGQVAAPTPSNTALNPGHASAVLSVVPVQPAQQDPAQTQPAQPTQPRPADQLADLTADPLANSHASPSANVLANTPTDHIADPLINSPADPPIAGPGTGTNWPTATLNSQSVNTDKQHNPSSLGVAGIKDPMSAAHTTTRNLPVQTAPNGDNPVDSFTLGPSTISLPTVAGQQIQVGSSNSVIIDDVTITGGGAPATISGTVISVLPGGKEVVVGSSTFALIPTQLPSPPTLASQQIQAGSTGTAVVIGDQTITAGGAPATLSGFVVSVFPGGDGVVVGSSTFYIHPTQPSPLLTVGGQLIYSASNGGITFGTASITAGGPPATISGMVISLMPSGNGILIDGSKMVHLPTSSAPCFTTVEPSAITYNGVTLPIGGPAATISGPLVPLGPSGLEIESSTTPLSTSGQRLGSLILLGLGVGARPLTQSAAVSTTSSSSNTSSASLRPFNGDACRARIKTRWTFWILVIHVLAYCFLV